MAETNNKMMSMIQKLRMGVVGGKNKDSQSKPVATQVQEVKEKLQISEPAAAKANPADNSVEAAFNKVLSNWEKQHKKQKEKSTATPVNLESFNFTFNVPTIKESIKPTAPSAAKNELISDKLSQLKTEAARAENDIKLIIPAQLSDVEKTAIEELAKFIDDWVEKHP